MIRPGKVRVVQDNIQQNNGSIRKKFGFWINTVNSPKLECSLLLASEDLPSVVAPPLSTSVSIVSSTSAVSVLARRMLRISMWYLRTRSQSNAESEMLGFFISPEIIREKYFIHYAIVQILKLFEAAIQSWKWSIIHRPLTVQYIAMVQALVDQVSQQIVKSLMSPRVGRPSRLLYDFDVLLHTSVQDGPGNFKLKKRLKLTREELLFRYSLELTSLAALIQNFFCWNLFIMSDM